jgi:hypothetical protein
MRVKILLTVRRQTSAVNGKCIDPFVYYISYRYIYWQNQYGGSLFTLSPYYPYRRPSLLSPSFQHEQRMSLLKARRRSFDLLTWEWPIVLYMDICILTYWVLFLYVVLTWNFVKVRKLTESSLYRLSKLSPIFFAFLYFPCCSSLQSALHLAFRGSETRSVFSSLF